MIAFISAWHTKLEARPTTRHVRWHADAHAHQQRSHARVLGVELVGGLPRPRKLVIAAAVREAVVANTDDLLA